MKKLVAKFAEIRVSIKFSVRFLIHEQCQAKRNMLTFGMERNPTRHTTPRWAQQTVLCTFPIDP